MIWSPNAPYYVAATALFAGAGWYFYRDALVGPAILCWGTAVCLFLVSTPRMRARR